MRGSDIASPLAMLLENLPPMLAAPRTAALSLVGLIMLACPVSRPRSSDAPIRGVEASLTARAHSSISLAFLARLTRPSSVAAFALRRSRLKSVLEETHHKVVDQFDLGPVAPADKPTAFRSVALFDHHLPAALPLRC
jgi:hypothetical protein